LAFITELDIRQESKAISPIKTKFVFLLLTDYAVKENRNRDMQGDDDDVLVPLNKELEIQAILMIVWRVSLNSKFNADDSMEGLAQ
jgi:hypothetical protein